MSECAHRWWEAPLAWLGAGLTIKYLGRFRVFGEVTLTDFDLGWDFRRSAT